VRATPDRDGGATLVIAAPAAGRLDARAMKRTRMLATGRARSPRAGRVRLQLRSVRKTATRARMRTRLVITFRPRRGLRQTVTRSLTLSMRSSENASTPGPPVDPGRQAT
jgi:hypothetical protein